MKTKITVVLISIFVALMLISSGYGVWNKSLRIEGDIRVVPELDVLEAMESQLDDLEKQLDEEIMAGQNLDEEQLRLQIEENNLQAQANLNNKIITGNLVEEIGINTGEGLVDGGEEVQKESGKVKNGRTKGEKGNLTEDDDNNSGSELKEDMDEEIEKETENAVRNDNNDIVPRSEENINEETEGAADSAAESNNNDTGLKSGEDINEETEGKADDIAESNNNDGELNGGGGGHEGGN